MDLGKYQTYISIWCWWWLIRLGIIENKLKKNVVFKSGNGNILQQLWGFGERLHIKRKHLKKYVFVGQNNPGLSPDYQMECYVSKA